MFEDRNKNEPAVSKKDKLIIRMEKKVSTKGDAIINKRKSHSLRRLITFKTAKLKRNALFTNTKSKKKDSKIISGVHVIDRNVNNVVGMLNFIKFNNSRNKSRIKVISIRRKRRKEATNFAFDRFLLNKIRVKEIEEDS